ncbi:uncharacterized protein LOC134182479 [Corticium candelabrum]|uniref:uncharacterized protein LOC134182479 n=1 Tax=Corticium candelabrum TaxID=121492 RepID=UPI002E26ECB0|nr:uncharacterized protein LOC134182479 [Corticium candelabrum]
MYSSLDQVRVDSTGNDTRTKKKTSGDSALKVYFALTVGVGIGGFIVSVRLPDACFDHKETIVIVYAVIQSVWLWISTLASIGYLIHKKCSAQLRPKPECDCFSDICKAFRLFFYHHPEIVPMTLLGLATIGGSIPKMVVLNNCMSGALVKFEIVYMVSESVFILVTIWTIVTQWLHNPKCKENLKNGQYVSVNSGKAPERRDIDVTFARWPSCLPDPQRVLLLCYVISILIILVSSAADEGAQETTFNAVRKCSNNTLTNKCKIRVKNSAELTNNFFAPLKMQFCFVTLMILVSVWITLNSSQKDNSSGDQKSGDSECYSKWYDVILNIVVILFGVGVFAVYVYYAVQLINTSNLTSNSTANATNSTMSQSTSFDESSLYSLSSKLKEKYMENVKNFLKVQISVELVSSVVLLILLCVRFCCTQKQDIGVFNGGNIDDVIVMTTCTAVTIHCVFNLASYMECLERHDKCTLTSILIGLEIASLALDIVQGFLQTALLLILKTLCHPVKTRADVRRNLFYGNALTFLSFVNLAICLGDCLVELREARSARGYLVGFPVYPSESWTFVTQLYYPLGVFFRLYSANAFWKSGVNILYNHSLVKIKSENNIT